MERNYTTTIESCNRELDFKDKIRIADVSDAIKLDNACGVEPLVIHPDIVASISIHNEHSDNKDYRVYIVTDTSGNKYKTSSESFWNALNDIISMIPIEEYEEDSWNLKVYKLPSKNYSGEFITCSII